jgi:hypothetical protein
VWVVAQTFRLVKRKTQNMENKLPAVNVEEYLSTIKRLINTGERFLRKSDLRQPENSEYSEDQNVRQSEIFGFPNFVKGV